MKPSMKRHWPVASALFAAALAPSLKAAPPAASSLANSADSASHAQQQPDLPKNLARQHLGANLLIFNPASQKFVPTEAAAAWLDDDVATGWPAANGHQFYLLALAEPQLISNFCISAHASAGTISLYAGDEMAAPEAKSWHLLEKNVSLDSINGKLGQSFGRFAKYVLIETNLTEAGPWYSLYLYGERPATAFHMQQRAQPIDPHTVFGPYVNSETNFSLSSLYAHSEVSFANARGGAASWAAAIDDNPETAVNIAPSEKESALVIRYDNPHTIQRIAVLTDSSTKGKLDFFLISEKQAAAASVHTESNASQYIKASNSETAAAQNSTATIYAGGPISLAGLAPVTTISFDGSSERGSADFTPVAGSVLVARWTPQIPGQMFVLREVNSFSGDLALNDHEIAPDEVGERAQVDSSKEDGKETLAPVGDGKEPLPAVAEAPPKTPFIPGTPPFPPNTPILAPRTPVPPPNTPPTPLSP